jgi:xanthine dehydrogenase accessory factor
MRDVIGDLIPDWNRGQTAALATVVRTFHSAPRPAGASMLVTSEGAVVGSVSGGCVEGAVYELAREVIDTGRPTLVRYGISDDDAFAVGLTCGGILDVFVEPVSRETFPELDTIRRDLATSVPIGIVTVIEHPDPLMLGRHLIVRGDGVTGDLGSERLTHVVGDDARGLLAAGRTTTIGYGPEGERDGEGLRVFVASFAPRPRMLVFGAVDFAAALTRLADFLGYRVTVCDARAVFATPARFPGADEVVVAWPHRYFAEQSAAGLLDARTVVCVLTHDPKFDVPLLELALDDGNLAYVGAMGSLRTHDDRIDRLRAAAVPEVALARLHSPIGLDLGARTPEETAVSIMAEVIAGTWGGTGESLGDRRAPIHHDRAEHDSLAEHDSASV